MTASEELSGVYLDNHQFTKREVVDLMEFYREKELKKVILWMNTWEQLKDTAIPIRFKEDFKLK